MGLWKNVGRISFSLRKFHGQCPVGSINSACDNSHSPPHILGLLSNRLAILRACNPPDTLDCRVLQAP